MEINENIKQAIKAFLGSTKEKHSIPEETQEICDLSVILSELLKLSDEDWGMYAFSRDPLEGKFDADQKKERIRKSVKCGVDEANLIKKTYQFNALDELSDYLGFQIENKSIPDGGSHVIFAQFAEPTQITIFMDSVDKAKKLFKNTDLRNRMGIPDIYNILLAHEIFHVIEFHKKTTIYSQTEMIELWRKPFSNQSKIICLGEIAAMAFAREILGLNYSPFIFDVLFMYGYDDEAATALYKDILEIAAENHNLIFT